jgi:hypothetical protein
MDKVIADWILQAKVILGSTKMPGRLSAIEWLA